MDIKETGYDVKWIRVVGNRAHDGDIFWWQWQEVLSMLNKKWLTVHWRNYESLWGNIEFERYRRVSHL
jgi:hypothetical protein